MGQGGADYRYLQAVLKDQNIKKRQEIKRRFKVYNY